MKLLSIVVPCYNSMAYMAHAVDSLLPGGDEVEILIVNDGSTDDTARIADTYALEYPGSVRVICQENGGHGAAVMTGISVINVTQVMMAPAATPLNIMGMAIFQNVLSLEAPNTFPYFALFRQAMGEKPVIR